jgi:hypothetical protein
MLHIHGDLCRMNGLMRATALATTLGGLVAGVAGIASAEEYCVTCTGPDAKYRCIIGNGDRPATRTQRGQMLCITELAHSGNHASCSVGAASSAPCDGDQRTVMLPEAPIADVPPPVAATPTPPQQAQPIYSPAGGGSYAQPAGPPAGQPQNGGSQTPGDSLGYGERAPGQTAGQAPGEEPGKQDQAGEPGQQPQTVEDIAKKTVKASGDSLKKAGKAVANGAQSAGNAVGSAVKKTWTCLSSLFGNC